MTMNGLLKQAFREHDEAEILAVWKKSNVRCRGDFEVRFPVLFESRVLYVLGKYQKN